MEIPLRCSHSYRIAEFITARRFKSHIVALILLLPFVCALGSSQAPVTTTVSGTVYDPRTTASALPLPNVLVYVVTAGTTLAPLPSGVQCLTTSAPSGVVSYTNTAVDGTFTLTNVPENASYTLVIQAGKWRRQFAETVAAAPLTGLVLNMPANHNEGDIPMIAISTGSVDALECVLLDMGISPTEFTDDNGSVNAGGHIHLYKGSSSAGAEINASTPNESTLMSNAGTMNNYDVLMFPCQSNASNQATATGATNLLNYADAGGRVFATHFSYAWLNPASPYDSQFPAVADWVGDTDLANGEATINTKFNDGLTLAQWLLNAGASTSFGQVALSTLRNDISGVIPPTQSWATLNSDGDIMQMTFNTPVGAAAANQCGRVLFNEYHVYNSSSAGAIYNSSLPNGQTFVECSAQPHIMTPQEEMLEYALFDLSAFVQPVVVPTLSIVFNPSPLVVKQNDTADQVTVDVTNTSSTTPISGTAILTISLPSLVTATAITDSTGGWVCTLATLTCTRTSGLAASASDSVNLTLSVGAYPPGGLTSYTGLITATVSSVTFSNNVSNTDTVIFQQPPAITWATPAPIIYGTALSGVQLDATTTVAGSFTYNPPAGTVLSTGLHTLTATFNPTDTTDYTASTATVTLTVIPATPGVTITSTANPVFLTAGVSFNAVIQSLGTPPTGTVVFYDGTAQLGSVAVSSGAATFSTSALTAGLHSITAAYSGDTSYGAATSSALTETIQDFAIAPASGSSSVTVSAGGLAVYSLVISPIDGPTLPGAVNLSVSGLPLQATAVLTPATINANSSATGFTVQVKLPGQLSADGRRTPFHPGSLPIALGLILLPFAHKLRKARSRLYRLVVIAVVGAALAAAVSGCGGSLTPQSFSFTVSGASASGSLSHSTTVNLTVQ